MDEKFLKAAIVRCLRGSGLFLSWSRAPRCLSAAHGSCPHHHSLSEGRQPYSEILVPVPCTALWLLLEIFVHKVFKTNLNSSRREDSPDRKSRMLQISCTYFTLFCQKLP